MPILKPARRTCGRCGSVWWQPVRYVQLRSDVFPHNMLVEYPPLDEKLVYRCAQCGAVLFEDEPQQKRSSSEASETSEGR